MAPATNSLPVPLSPRMRTVALVGATVRISVAQGGHGRGFADDLVEAHDLADAGAQDGDLLALAIVPGAPGDGLAEPFGVERFGQVIDGARLDGLDRQLRGVVGRDHEDRQLRACGP